MLIVKGWKVSFDLDDDTGVDAPASWAMLHDPTGRYWKSTSVLVMPFKKLSRETRGDSYSKDYLGGSWDSLLGDVTLPPKPLGAWVYEGEVECIWYSRHGAKYGGRRFRHPFNSPGIARLLKGRGHARLYSRRGAFRLELSRGAILDGRGIVWP